MKGNRSWKAKRAHDEPKPDPAILLRARRIQDAIIADIKIERSMQAQIYEVLLQKHRGDVPVRTIWNHIADRREAAIITTVHGAGLARS